MIKLNNGQRKGKGRGNLSSSHAPNLPLTSLITMVIHALDGGRPSNSFTSCSPHELWNPPHSSRVGISYTQYFFFLFPSVTPIRTSRRNNGVKFQFKKKRKKWGFNQGSNNLSQSIGRHIVSSPIYPLSKRKLIIRWFIQNPCWVLVDAWIH